MLTYVLGPFLSLLPMRWRKGLSLRGMNWPRAAVLSGFTEFLACLAAFIKWYFTCMNTWVNRGLDVAMSGKGGADITDHAVGAAALLIWASHPLTWVFGYFSLEGAVRFCGAAFSGSVIGTLPFFLAGKILGIFMPAPKTTDDIDVAGSFFSAISEKWSEKRHAAGPDEVVAKRDGSDEILEIRASRRKPDWDPPRVVRIKDVYYRLEGCSKGAPRRPFVYRLRRLAAGVPGRSVLLYELDEVTALTNP